MLRALTALSLAVLAAWSVLSVGYETVAQAGLTLRDNAGNELGFSLPLTQGLAWRLALASLSPAAAGLWASSPWTLTCGAAQLATLVITWRRTVPRRWLRGWLLAQTLLFAPGLLGLLAWPSVVFGGAWDGETVSDVPTIVMAATPWLITTWIWLAATWLPDGRPHRRSAASGTPA